MEMLRPLTKRKFKYITSQLFSILKSCLKETEEYCIHCVKSVHIWSYSGPYSVRMRENTDQDNSKYGHISRSDN